jgi:hypothetical protein
MQNSVELAGERFTKPAWRCGAVADCHAVNNSQNSAKRPWLGVRRQGKPCGKAAQLTKSVV